MTKTQPQKKKRKKRKKKNVVRVIHGFSYAEYNAIRYWLKKKFGNATKCEDLNCTKKSRYYCWVLKRGKKLVKRRDNFGQMCRSCCSKSDIMGQPRINKPRKYKRNKNQIAAVKKALKGKKRSKAVKEKISKSLLKSWKKRNKKKKKS